MSEDPGSLRTNDLNLYRYTVNNPLVMVDPSGKKGSSVVLGLCAVLAAGAAGEQIRRIVEGRKCDKSNENFLQSKRDNPPPIDKDGRQIVLLTNCQDIRDGKTIFSDPSFIEVDLSQDNK